MSKREGREAWNIVKKSNVFKQFSLTAPADVIMKLFLPPENEDMMQISRPLSKDRKEWIEGFDEARNEDMENG